MGKVLRLLSVILLTIFFTSCRHCLCAPSNGLRLGMVSFDSIEIDTIIIRKFSKGTNFNNMLDTLQWDKRNVTFQVRNDTFQTQVTFGDIGLKSKFDYQVFLPALNKTSSITDMNERQEEHSCWDRVECLNSITSCKLDGRTTPVSNDILYVKK